MLAGKLSGRAVMVTGAGGGLGRAVSLAAAEAGARTVVLAEINAERSHSVALAVAAAGALPLEVDLDVADAGAWNKALDLVEAESGALDVLVNNAGITHRAGVVDLLPEDWSRVISVNQTGVFLGMRAVAPRLRVSGGGSIVNMASFAGFTGYKAAAYTASKWAVRGLTRVAAAEFAPWNIRVNAVCPGFVSTPLTAGVPRLVEAFDRSTAMGRGCEPSEVAAAVCFLASEEASFITGTDLLVDGGYLSDTTRFLTR